MCLVIQLRLTLCDPLDYSLSASSVHEIFQAKIIEWVDIFLPQGIFPTQRLNPHFLCLLQCRWSLYPLSHQGSSSLSWKWKWSHSVKSDSLQSHGLQSTRLLCPWGFPGKSTGVGCHILPQGIFLTQGSNMGSCIAGRFFTNWATREAPDTVVVSFSFIL